MLPYKEKAALQSQVLVRNASCMGTTGVRRSFLVSLYLYYPGSSPGMVYSV